MGPMGAGMLGLGAGALGGLALGEALGHDQPDVVNNYYDQPGGDGDDMGAAMMEAVILGAATLGALSRRRRGGLRWFRRTFQLLQTPNSSWDCRDTLDNPGLAVSVSNWNHLFSTGCMSWVCGSMGAGADCNQRHGGRMLPTATKQDSFQRNLYLNTASRRACREKQHRCCSQCNHAAAVTATDLGCHCALASPVARPDGALMRPQNELRPMDAAHEAHLLHQVLEPLDVG